MSYHYSFGFNQNQQNFGLPVSPSPRNHFCIVNFKALGHSSEITTKLQRNNPTVNQKSERKTSRKDYKGRRKQMAWRVDYNTSSLPRQRRNWYQMLLRAPFITLCKTCRAMKGPHAAIPLSGINVWYLGRAIHAWKDLQSQLLYYLNDEFGGWLLVSLLHPFIIYQQVFWS